MKKILFICFLSLIFSCSKTETSNDPISSLNSSNVDDYHLVGLIITKGVISQTDTRPYFTVSLSLKNTENLKSCFFLGKLPGQQTFSRSEMSKTSPMSFVFASGFSTFSYKFEYTYNDGRVIVSNEKLAG